MGRGNRLPRNHDGTTYTREVTDEICRLLSEGETLNHICKQPGMPAIATVYNWVRDDIDGLAARYSRAREIGYFKMADEIVDESRVERIRTTRVLREGPDGTFEEIRSEDNVARSKLIVDSLKWILAKALPKVYGGQQFIAQQTDGTLVVVHNLPDPPESSD